MISGRRRRGTLPAESAPAYREVFVSRVHQLLELAYRRLDPRGFGTYQETAITGELVRVMDEVIDDPGSPEWVRHFSVHDDPPVNAPGRLGRSRKRLDIKVVSSYRLPRSRFSFEAKRLGKENPVADYLGAEGLGCFIAGDYAREEPDAGMLGYVQCDTLDDWAKNLGEKIGAAAQGLCLVADHAWKLSPFRGGPARTYHTRHVRSSVGGSIDVYHTLLVCC